MELWSLTARHLRTTLRRRAARVVATVFLLGLAGAAWLGAREAHAGGVLMLLALLLLALLVSAIAVGTGAALPEDRVAGREEWLSTLTPAAWKRRLAVVLAGWLLAAGLGVLGGLSIGLLTAWVRPDVTLRVHGPLALPKRTVSGADGAPLVFPLPAHAAELATVEVDLRPRFQLRRQGAPVDRIRIHWESGTRSEEREIPARSSQRFEVPADAQTLAISSRTPGVRIRAVGARRLGGTRSVVLSLGLGGLLLGLLAGAVTPVAVFVSRSTTGQTAAAAAFCLLLFGAARTTLLELAAAFDPGGVKNLAPAVLHGLAWIAPDARIFSVFEQVVAGRVPMAGSAVLPWQVLLYTLCASLLACAPLPLRWRTGVNT